MADLYSSTSLLENRRSIRLLHVNEISEQASEALSCELSVINLDDEHSPFAALTYVWNIDDDNKTFMSLKCRDQTLELTRNGYEALKHLRNKLGAFDIWIDAICINQNNDDEKMDQIKLMGDIYSEAETVYVWLGVGGDACDRALQFIRRDDFQRYVRWEEESAQYEISKGQIRKAAWAYGFGGIVSIAASSQHATWQDKIWARAWTERQEKVSFDDLMTLLDNPWITRMWTFQEILLASNPVVVVGPSHLPWVLFERAVIFLQYSRICRKSAPRLHDVLEAWTELVLGRDQLFTATAASSDRVAAVSSDSTADVDDHQPTQLLRYRDFMIDISETANKIKERTYDIAGYLIVSIIVTGFAGIVAAALKSNTSVAQHDDEVHAMVEVAGKAVGQIANSLKACGDLKALGCMYAMYIANDAAKNVTSAYNAIQPVIHEPKPFRIGYPILLGTLLLLTIVTILTALFLRRRTVRPMYLTEIGAVHLVNGICTRKCKDARDKPLAMLAILQRLAGHEMELTRASNVLRDSYKGFSKKMIDTTKSLALLIPAAIQGFQDFPSWVPDWAAAPDPFWVNPPLFHGQQGDATPGSRSVFRWSSKNEDILIVGGLQQPDSIFRCYVFTEAPSIYDPKDDSIHLKNLREMSLFLDIEGLPKHYSHLEILKKISKKYMPDNPAMTESQLNKWHILFELFHVIEGENLLFTAITKPSLETKAYLFFKFAALLRPGVLFMLIHGLVFTKLENVWETHVTLCNALARHRKVLFSTKEKRVRLDISHVDPRRRAHNRRLDKYLSQRSTRGKKIVNRVDHRVSIGVAEVTVQPGDKIILVGGVQTPLIIRTTLTKHKLISPAMIPSLMTGRGWVNSIEDENLTLFELN
jgi:hypothetical protein